jgi:hypothetical protein
MIETKTVSISADSFFEYNATKLKNPEDATKKAKEILSKYQDDLKIKSIETFTDPIGGSCKNQELAQARSEEIKRITKDFLKNEKRDLGDIDKVIISGDGPKTDEKSKNLWNKCLKLSENVTDGKGIPPLLKRTTDKKFENCDLKKKVDFKNAGYDDYIGNPKSKIFGLLTNCLEEFRVVEFHLEGTPKPTPSQPQNKN